MPEERDTFVEKMPPYDDIRAALADAVSQTLSKDWDLIALGGHEQAIAHRIAFYLEGHFRLFHTDCEYNRRKHKAKEIDPESGKASRKMRPDIIVHIRNTAHNVLAVEMKANANNKKSDDLIKLRALRSEADYLYKGTAFVRVFNSARDISKGTLRATICWYDVLEDKIVEQVEQRENIESAEHAEWVLIAYRQRIGRTKPGDHEKWPALQRLHES